MLWKLSFNGIKSRLRDYLILFSGLVIASAIFYMFESLASNEEFLNNNTPISSTVFIFRLGTILLGVITFVYILYINSFLMTLRQKDYAMFMMLGAKTRKIAQMIFAETFIVGIVSTILGSTLGMLLADIVTKLLVTQLGMNITNINFFSLNSLIVTILFFFVLFLLAAIANALFIMKKPILTLIRSNGTPTRIKQSNSSLLLEAILGILLLACGYYVFRHVEVYKKLSFVISLFTIILGTYFSFHSVVIFFLSLLKRNDQISLKRINNFTLSQLSFRIRDYTRVLSMVAILFSLALGALTVGLGFKNEISELAYNMAVYDLVMNNPKEKDQQTIKNLSPSISVTYTQKEDSDTIYYNENEFRIQPFIKLNQSDKKIVPVKEMNRKTVQDELRSYELPEQQKKEIKVISQLTFNQLNLPKSTLQLVKLKEFEGNLESLKTLVSKNKKNNPSLQKTTFISKQKYEIYEMFNSIYSGFEFMGFFLGLAFLTMLASCLMFKILSGSKSDIVRYQMLGKIGVRNNLLKQSIKREIGVLFLAPGVLGVVHVLFGLQMFSVFIQNPYNNIWVPFIIFFTLYSVYYIITVWIYTDIVLPKK
ncbi:FtsX-like permease family protein [Enterococcus faecalis]|uniref:FtsX-like permease family protein n=1 Tax=Enterococcus faecalis TaxID=1351 RepID=UPI00045AAD7B|nr:FtsX-like permease family protein [Enterococcus faecalis]KAJ75293.1 ABC-type antimicrobial peptide transport system, permease component [Enterococcus faecalis MTUP9]